MNNLLKQMQQDAGATALDSMGKIGAVATDVADTEKEIQDLEDQDNEHSKQQLLIIKAKIAALNSSYYEKI